MRKVWNVKNHIRRIDLILHLAMIQVSIKQETIFKNAIIITSIKMLKREVK